MSFQLSETIKPSLDAAAVELVAEVESAGGALPYVQAHDEGYYDRPVHNIFAAFATFVEPRPLRPEAPDASAFMRGTVLGLRTVELALGSAVVDELATAEWFNVHNTDLPKIDKEDAADTICRLIRGMGYAGYRIADAFHADLEDWDIAVTQNAATTRVFKDGFGFPIFHAQRLKDKDSTLDVFKAILESNGIFADWNPEEK